MSDKIFAGNWTLPRLRALSPSQRQTTRENALANASPEAMELAEAIEGLGLPYSDFGGMRRDDPIFLAMYEVIFSSEGKAACLKATEDGLPALAGVEQMLVNELGDQYRPEGQGTMTSGGIVGMLMQSLGYKNVKSLPMPAGSVAKTAALWERK